MQTKDALIKRRMASLFPTLGCRLTRDDAICLSIDQRCTVVDRQIAVVDLLGLKLAVIA